MILKGSSRRGSIDLAVHLSNEVDNERVEIMEVRGAASRTLYDAFREWEAIGDCSNAKKPLYSLSINPDPQQRDWTDEEWQIAVKRIEDKLGLTGQPRAIVFHHKVGQSDFKERKHCHVVWSRIETKDHQLRAISNSHDRYKLRSISKELTKDFGLVLRRGRRGRSFDHALSHAKNRDVETSAERKTTITRAWNTHTEPKAFTVALRNKGYIIARGDRRRFVVVDQSGQVHALTRQIDGTKTKAVKDRLESQDNFPSVEQAKDEQRIIQSRDRQAERQRRKRIDLSREQQMMRKLQRMAKRADQLKDHRREQLEREEKEMRERHKAELDMLHRRYRARTAKIIRQRALTKPKGLTKHLRTLIGYETLLRWKHAQQDRDRLRAFTNHLSAIKKAQTKQLERLEQRADLIQKQERRETKSLERFAKRLSLDALNNNLDAYIACRKEVIRFAYDGKKME